jgi:hypothetical protein
MRLPWMTTRRIMVVVAVVALILCGENLWRRRVTYQRRASINAIYARQFRETFEKQSLVVFAKHHGPEFAGTPALRLKWAEYHESRARKYQHAASRPWETVPADPPPPEILPAAEDY